MAVWFPIIETYSKGLPEPLEVLFRGRLTTYKNCIALFMVKKTVRNYSSQLAVLLQQLITLIIQRKVVRLLHQ